MSDEQATASTETTEETGTGTETPEEPGTAAAGQADTGNGQTEPETFPRDYVEKLRKENGRYRQRAGQADTLAKRLHVELVRATGRLADPDDLEFNEEHLDDPDKLTAALDELLDRKPHLASRKPTGDVGQGARQHEDTVSLAGLMRSRAG